MGLYLFIGVLVYLAFCVGWNILFKRNSVFRFFTVVAAAILAFITTMVFKSMVASEDVMKAVLDAVGNENAEITGILEASSSLMGNVISMVAALVAPLVFFCCFIVFDILSWVVRVIVFIVKKIAGQKLDKSKVHVRALFGLGQGLIVTLCLLFPISYYSGLAADTLDAVSKLSDEPAIQDAVEVVEAIDDTAVIKIHRLSGGNLLSYPLTSFKVELGGKTETAYLSGEIGSVLDLVGDFTTLTEKDFKDYGEAEKTVLSGLGNSLTKSRIITAAISEIVGNLAQAWSDGEKFAGIDKPSLSEDFDPLVDRIIEVLGDDAKNIDHLKEDVNTFASIVVVMIDNGMLSDDSEMSEDVLSGDLVPDLIDVLNSNPRMRPLIPTLTNIGLSMIGKGLELPENSEAAYNQFIADVLAELKENQYADEATRKSTLEEKLTASLDGLGVTGLKKSDVAILADALVTYFADGGVVAPSNASAADVDAFFEAVTAAADAEAAGQSPVADYEGSQTGKLNDVPTNNIAAQTGKLLVASKLGHLSDTDSDRTPFKLTIEAILITQEVIDGVADLDDEEAAALNQAIKDVFAHAGSLIGATGDDADAMDLDQMLSALGGVLDVLSGNENLYGADKTQTLMKALLNSKQIKDTAKLSADSIEAMLDKMTSNDTSYTNLLGSVGKTTSVLESMTNKDNLTVEDIDTLVDALKDGSGSIIAEMVTPDKMQEIGFDPETAESASEIISGVLDGIGSLNEEAREQEVGAIKHIINIAMKSNSDSTTENAFGADGHYGVEADELVDTIISSSIVSSALGNENMDAVPFGAQLSESDATALKTAISIKSEDATPEQQVVLNNLANLFGITLVTPEE